MRRWGRGDGKIKRFTALQGVNFTNFLNNLLSTTVLSIGYRLTPAPWPLAPSWELWAAAAPY